MIVNIKLYVYFLKIITASIVLKHGLDDAFFGHPGHPDRGIFPHFQDFEAKHVVNLSK